MSETQNTPRNDAEQEMPSSGAPQPKLKKLLGRLNAFLDYIDEEVPAPQPDPGAPRSMPKKAWAAFNSFLDSLEEPVAEDADADAEKSAAPLKKTGRICWEVVFHGTILVFLFVLAIFATIKALDFVNERHVPFYPSREVMRYLTAEHESLEAVADAPPAGKDRRDHIPLDRFGEECAGILKPVRIYSDEYGVYLMTAKSLYTGENGIFIARDKDNMPDDLSWGLIEGRVFTYAFFE